MNQDIINNSEDISLFDAEELSAIQSIDQDNKKALLHKLYSEYSEDKSSDAQEPTYTTNSINLENKNILLTSSNEELSNNQNNIESQDEKLLEENIDLVKNEGNNIEDVYHEEYMNTPEESNEDVINQPVPEIKYKVKKQIRSQDTVSEMLYNEDMQSLSPEQRYQRYFLLGNRISIYKDTDDVLKLNNMEDLAKFITLKKYDAIVAMVIFSICIILSVHVLYATILKA